MSGRSPDIVVRVDGTTYGFRLPDGNTLEELPPAKDGSVLVRLSVPGAIGETCRLLEKIVMDGEIVYRIEPAGVSSSVGVQPPGYPWRDLLNSEQQRLGQEIEQLTGAPFVDAWAHGESHEEHFAALRAKLRGLRRRPLS